MTLADLYSNQSGIITKVRGRGAFRKRITEMGFIKGKTVKVIKNAPLKDPIEYSLMGYEISLRRSEAAMIEILKPGEGSPDEKESFSGVISLDMLRKAEKKGKIINVAMVGNPNSGKTTLFNYATRSKERVGNYSGVTVDAKYGKFSARGYKFNIVDLPGTYSLTAYTPEELFVRDHITREMPDVVINVVDASNLERNLYLTTQLIDMDIKVVMALNMYDELLESGDALDYDALALMTGVPVVPTIGSKNIGITDLFQKVIDVYEDNDRDIRHVHINYGQEIEKSLKRVQEKIRHSDNQFLTDKVSTRFLALKLLEKDADAKNKVSSLSNAPEISQAVEEEITRLEAVMNEDSETLITDAKYGFISGALRETLTRGTKSRHGKSVQIDHILTHQFFGFPVFLLFIFIMFQATFTLGSYPMEWIEELVAVAGGFLDERMAGGSLKDLLINGIIGGVGGVIVFLPNILILFFFISLMEDTGYMARAAFIMDKLMHRIGLHGKSFIPLIMGFGCNVPAIMATRTIENRHNRLMTILINPFMSCSARLPVYVLIIGAFFPTHPGTVLFGIYLLGILMAIVMALILKKTLFRSDDVPFVMELPPYRVPTLKTTTRHMWHKGSQYLQKMGGIILVASVIVWALGYFPRETETGTGRDYLASEVKATGNIYDTDAVSDAGILPTGGDPAYLPGRDAVSDAGILPTGGDPAYLPGRDAVSDAGILPTGGDPASPPGRDAVSETGSKEYSYIGRIGKFIEPVIAPLGFDWKMGVALLSGVAAKEIVVSTMGVLYQANPEASLPTDTLGEKLQQQTYADGSKVFTTASALSFLVFILLYFPCVAVVAAVKNEAGHWKWAVLTVVYTTGLAWVMSFLVYQAVSMLM
jgi:ferrous iron transport protein B